MAFDTRQRRSILRERAAEYVRVALVNVTREYPHMPYFVAGGPDDYRTHRQLHPAFYGCFDWHSCVEMEWAVVRLLRYFPAAVPDGEARTTFDALLTPAHLAREVEFFSNPRHRSLERPYGWGWLLTLQHELLTWNDPSAARWAAAVEPLARLLSTRLVDWLPALTYPHRTGVHPNTAFSLSRCLDYATLRAADGDANLLAAIRAAAARWFASDVDYPAHYEPSGADFLSPALCEAELMSRILEPPTFSAWLDHFLPGLASGRPRALFTPAIVADAADGQGAHLHGLNLSRAWAFVLLAARLAPDDPRGATLLAAAERHADVSLPHVAGSDYMVEHWLAAYATLLLSCT
jgi:Protein of unknown function (DUF2891)